MDQSLFYFLSSGVVFGLSSGVVPGPLLTLTISESLRGGFPAGLKVSVVPLFTDGPLILLSWVVLSKLEDMSALLGGISLIGGLFLFYLAAECMALGKVSLEVSQPEGNPLKKGILTNVFNPAPYLFWATVGAPVVLAAGNRGLLALLLFLGGFFGCIIGSKLVVALLVTRFRDFLRSNFYLSLMRLMALALAVFGVLFLKQAWAFFSSEPSL